QFEDMRKGRRIVKSRAAHHLCQRSASKIVRNAVDRRQLVAEVIGDGEGPKDERTEGMLPGRSTPFLPRWPRDAEWNRPRDLRLRSCLPRLNEQVRQKQREQLSGGVGPRRVDGASQWFVKVLRFTCTEILLWRHKCLTAEVFAPNGGVPGLLSKKDCVI